MPALYAHSLFLDQCVRVLPNDSHYPVPRACYLSSLGARSIPLVSAVQRQRISAQETSVYTRYGRRTAQLRPVH